MTSPRSVVVDTSALIAVLLREPESDRLIEALARSAPLVSAATYVECGIVIDNRVGPATRLRFDQILRTLAVEVVPLTAEQAEVAREAHRRFGRGSGHPARLNLGDCYSYALAATTGFPLAFVGDDFAVTDLVAMPY